MIETVSFHEIAELEMNEAAEYYEARVKGLGEAFITEVERCVKQIQENPELAAKIFKKSVVKY